MITYAISYSRFLYLYLSLWVLPHSPFSSLFSFVFYSLKATLLSLFFMSTVQATSSSADLSPFTNNYRPIIKQYPITESISDELHLYDMQASNDNGDTSTYDDCVDKGKFLSINTEEKLLICSVITT